MGTLQGKWRFNETLTRPNVEINENVNFEFPIKYTIGNTYNATGKGDHIYTSRAVSDSPWVLNYSYTIHFDLPDSTPSSTMKGVYNGDNNEWLVDYEANYRIIDFGSEPQTVSDDFYNWISVNAAEITTISGCWQWKEMADMILPEVGYEINEDVKFQAWERGIIYHNGVRISCRVDYYAADGEWDGYEDEEGDYLCLIVNGYDTNNNNFNSFDYYTWWDNSGIGAARLIDFGESEQIVTKEFYDLLTTNAIQVNLDDFFVKVSGSWKWNNTLVGIPDEIVSFNVNFIANGSQYDSLLCGTMDGLSGLIVQNAYLNNVTICYISGYGWMDTAYSSSLNVKMSDAYRIWDFGKKEVYMNINAYNFLVVNAVNVTGTFASIKYGDRILANPKKLAKLLTKNKVLTNDLVIEGINSRPYVEPLEVFHNGTYINSYETESFTWSKDSEYDISVEFQGIPLKVKKVENLSVPECSGHLYNPNYKVIINCNDGSEEQSKSFSELEIIDEHYYYMMNELQLGLMFIVSGAALNSEIGAELFENNSVYVSDFLWAIGQLPEKATLTIVAPGKRIEAISQVVVDVGIPDGYIEQPWAYMEITENGEYDVTNYATANVNVTVPSSYMVQNLSDLPNDANNGSFAIVLGGV